jgi:hypothetical protein
MCSCAEASPFAERLRVCCVKIEALHFTVSANVAVCCTWLDPDPDVAMMVTVDVLEEDEEVEIFVELPQPVNRFRDATLRTSRSIQCRLRRFLQPKKQNTDAIATPGNNGLKSRRIAVVDGAMDTVIVEVEAVVPEGTKLGGEKLHVNPSGKPE